MRHWKVLLAATATALAVAPLAPARALPAVPSVNCDWPMFGQNLGRPFAVPDACQSINTINVHGLRPKWHVDTGSPVTAQPAVVEGVVYVGTAGGKFYAVDANSGAVKWTHQVTDQSSNSYGKIVSSAAVADVDGKRVAVFGGGATLYALDANTGKELASACVDPDPVRHCGPGSQTVEIESSPALVPTAEGGTRVIVGMDFNEDVGVGRAGVINFHLHLTAAGWKLEPKWKFDPEMLTTYTTDPLHEGGKGNSCGNVWSSPTIDKARNLIVLVTGNCDKEPVAPGDGEAILGIALDTGALRWRHQPRPADNGLDLDFGATPNLLPNGNVGEGGKDGFYYSLPATGSGAVTPDWTSKVSTGSDFGGMIGSTALGKANGKPAVFASTAIPVSTRDPQTSFQEILANPGLATGLHAIDATTGKKLWDAPTAPAFGAAVYSGGVVFIPDTVMFSVQAFDANTGVPLWVFPMKGPPASPPAIVGKSLYVGSGIDFGAPLNSIGGITGFQTDIPL